MNDSNIGSFASLAGAATLDAGLKRWLPPTGIRLLLLLSLTACGFPRPMDLVDDAAVDAPEPAFVLHVSPAGDDAGDGFGQPVKTLKRALGLAAADTRITKIVLAGGTYSGANGETFPYTVPPNVTIAGPAGGGAVLAGSKAEPGISLNAGMLQDLELRDFMVAVTVTGMSTLNNLRISTSAIALQAETSAVVNVDHLDIAGTPGSCTRGIVLNGASALMATTLSTRDLGISLDARDQSATSISDAAIMADQSCGQSTLTVSSNHSFSIAGGLVDGGDRGIVLAPRLPNGQLRAVISNTTIRNTRSVGLEGTGTSRESVSLEMIGGALSNNGNIAADLIWGTWSLSGVLVGQRGIYLQNGELKMRGCMVVGGGGIEVSDDASANFGTKEDPGRNLIQSSESSGLTLAGNSGATLIEAVGNTWNPNVQGADAAGQYVTQAVVIGPVSFARGNNFTLVSGWRLSR